MRIKLLAAALGVVLLNGCANEKKEPPVDIEQIKFVAKWDGIIEERSRWTDWRGERVDSCGKIIRSYQSRVVNAPDCCIKAQLIMDEFLEVFNQWKILPEQTLPSH